MDDSTLSQLKGRRVVVTGGAGFIGSHVCETLFRLGAEIVVVDDLSTGFRDNLEAIDSQSLHFIEGDCADADRMTRVLAGADAVVHLAALVSVQRSIEAPAESFHRNVQAGFSVLSAAAARLNLPVVFASSAAVYGASPVVPAREDAALDPLSPYASDKLYLEFLAKGLRSRGGRCLGLRLFNVYGPRQRADSPYSGVVSKFLARAAVGEPCAIFGDGEQSRDFIHVSDVADALVRGVAYLISLSAQGGWAGVLNCGSGRSISINALHRLLAGDVAAVYGAEVPGEVRHSRADISKIREMLGWWPRTEFSAGLTELRIAGGCM